MIDELAELLGGFIGLVLLLAVLGTVAFLIGIVVVPVGLIGAGVLYYIHNIHLPQKHRKEVRARTEALYQQAQALSPTMAEFQEMLRDLGIVSPELHAIARELFIQEGLRPPVLSPISNDAIKQAQYQTELERFITAAQSEQYIKFRGHVVWALSEYERDETADNQLFRSTRKRSRAEIDHLVRRFINDEGLFGPLVAQLNQNYREQREIAPKDCKHDDYAWRYLKDTPLLPLADVDEMIGLSNRMYHTYLLGSSGSGKTNIIENIIAHDLRSKEDCCVIVIDSQTQLTEKLAALNIPKTAHITPKYDLALNLFDVGYEEMKQHGIEGETLINKTVGLLSFVLEGMMGADFSNPQKTIFQYVIQLVISIKGGNIYTFMDVLADKGHEQYATEISQLDQNMQRFFMVDYPSPKYKRTREAIRRRIDSLLLNPTFRRLFSAEENRIDMFAEMANRNLILIDTNKPMLDEAASSVFGRLFIAMILRASHRRFAEGVTSRPVYLIVDEAHEYFDQSVSAMLEQARKANIGLIVAHQSLSHAKKANIVDPLMVNTATKIIWTAYRDDAAKFAGSMQIKAEDILSLPQFTFGMHSRKQGFTPIKGAPNALSDFPMRLDRNGLRHEMEARYGQSRSNTNASSDDKSDAGHGSDSKAGKPPDVEMI